MNKKVIIISIITVMTLGLIFGMYTLFFNINNIPNGEYFKEVKSPNGTYTIKVYIVKQALSSDAVRCESVNNKTKKARNIYWEYKKSDVSIIWKSEELVSVNGIELNIKRDTYDWRMPSNLF